MTVVWNREWAEQLERKTLGELLYMALIDLPECARMRLVDLEAPSGAEARMRLGMIAARLKPCP